jgi:hypothetical protein
MNLYKFLASPGMRVALTKDKTGSNLPRAHWIPAGEINIEPNGPPRIGASSADILVDIEEVGYHVWPESAG